MTFLSHLPDPSALDRATFDREMLKRATRFSVCRFLGRGQYKTIYVPDLATAKAVRDEARKREPSGRFLVYGIVDDAEGNAELTIFVE
jgi:hypothetical protein